MELTIPEKGPSGASRRYCKKHKRPKIDIGGKMQCVDCVREKQEKVEGK
jgi:hypothetical protein